MKEKEWLTNVKYLRLSTLYWTFTDVFGVLKAIGINAENKMCLPNKEYISGHW